MNLFKKSENPLQAELSKLKKENEKLTEDLKHWKAKANIRPQGTEDLDPALFEHKYTDPDGLKYFFLRVEKLPRQRQIEMQAVLRQLEAGIDKDNIQSICEEIITKAGQGLHQNVIKLAVNLSDRSLNLSSPRLLYEAALICTFMEGEPLPLTSEFMQKKAAQFNKFPELRFFFMHMCLITIQKLADTSLDDFKLWVAQKELEEKENTPK